MADSLNRWHIEKSFHGSECKPISSPTNTGKVQPKDTKMSLIEELRQKVRELEGEVFENEIDDLDLEFLGEMIDSHESGRQNSYVFQRRYENNFVRTTLTMSPFLGGGGVIVKSRMQNISIKTNPMWSVSD